MIFQKLEFKADFIPFDQILDKMSAFNSLESRADVQYDRLEKYLQHRGLTEQCTFSGRDAQFEAVVWSLYG
jgi:hypothetical protein